MVIVPPKTTQGIVPIQLATIPLSKAPSSFEEQTKIQFTAAILPRSASGESSLTIERRMTMLMPSKAPPAKLYIEKIAV
jgi:hypothetical protein